MHAVLKRSERNRVTNRAHVSLVFHDQLVSTHHFIVFYQHHVVCAESSAKDDTGHPLETMDPLLSL